MQFIISQLHMTNCRNYILLFALFAFHVKVHISVSYSVKYFK